MPSAGSNQGTQYLKLGSVGPAVRDLQARLNGVFLVPVVPGIRGTPSCTEVMVRLQAIANRKRGQWYNFRQRYVLGKHYRRDTPAAVEAVFLGLP